MNRMQTYVRSTVITASAVALALTMTLSDASAGHKPKHAPGGQEAKVLVLNEDFEVISVAAPAAKNFTVAPEGAQRGEVYPPVVLDELGDEGL